MIRWKTDFFSFQKNRVFFCFLAEVHFIYNNLSYKLTTVKIAGIVFVASVVCKYLIQVTIKSQMQITKWYLTIILSLVRLLQLSDVVDAVADELLKSLHCCLNRCHHHLHHHHVLYTNDHSYLLNHLRLNHRLVSYFPNLMMEEEQSGKRMEKWNFTLYLQFVSANHFL